MNFLRKIELFLTQKQNQEIVFFGIFFVDKRFIFFFEKDSRLGLRRLRS